MLGDDSLRRAAVATAACLGLVFAVGAVAYEAFGIHASYPAAPGSGPLGETFGPTAHRWDSTWYLRIVEQGYGGPDLAFFPLFPFLTGLLGSAVGSPALAGLLISILATVAALALLHRLTRLELGSGAAARVVWVVALFPTAVFLPAVMTEALFLALSVGAFYTARLGRWGWAAGLGAAAALTRNSGVLLIVPIALLYLYGPRQDRLGGAAARSSWSPRFPVRGDALVLAAIPAALCGFLLFTWVEFGDPLATWHAQGREWGREFSGPLGAVPLAASDAWQGLAHLTGEGGASGLLGYGDPSYVAARSLREAGWLSFAALALAGVFRTLPPAYGVYAALAMLLPLSSPPPDDPLASFSRYLLVLFPLHMWLAGWARTRVRLAAVLVPSTALLVLYTAELANGRWV